MTINEARTLAEGKRQVAQAAAEVTAGAALAELHRAHRDNYAATLAALDEAKAGMNQNSPEFAELAKMHDAAKPPADTRPLFAARAAAYAAADRTYRDDVAAAGAEHGVLTGGSERARG